MFKRRFANEIRLDFANLQWKRKTKEKWKKKSIPHKNQKHFYFRILLATTNKGDAVFDPFLGTGTTAVVAKKLGRNYYGIEREKKYYDAAKRGIIKLRKLKITT